MEIYEGQKIVHRDAVSVELEAFFEDQVIVSKGVSRRHPTDKFDPQVGLKLAYSRALANIANKLEKQAAGLMKHKEDMQVAKQKAKLRREAEEAVAVKEQKWSYIFDVSPSLPARAHRPYTRGYGASVY